MPSVEMIDLLKICLLFILPITGVGLFWNWRVNKSKDKKVIIYD